MKTTDCDRQEDICTGTNANFLLTMVYVHVLMPNRTYHLTMPSISRASTLTLEACSAKADE